MPPISKSINPMVDIVGTGPDGVLCRHCEHLSNTSHHPTINKFVCSEAIRTIKHYVKLNGHRLTWLPCSLFKGDTVVRYKCSGCKKTFEIAKVSYDTNHFTGRCKSCGELSSKQEREEMISKLVLPVHDGCSPVSASATLSRDESECISCAGYDACLHYASHIGWSGWKGEKIKIKAKGRVKRNDRTGHRRVVLSDNAVDDRRDQRDYPETSHMEA